MGNGKSALAECDQAINQYNHGEINCWVCFRQTLVAILMWGMLQKLVGEYRSREHENNSENMKPILDTVSVSVFIIWGIDSLFL